MDEEATNGEIQIGEKKSKKVEMATKVDNESPGYETHNIGQSAA